MKLNNLFVCNTFLCDKCKFNNCNFNGRHTSFCLSDNIRWVLFDLNIFFREDQGDYDFQDMGIDIDEKESKDK